MGPLFSVWKVMKSVARAAWLKIWAYDYGQTKKSELEGRKVKSRYIFKSDSRA